MVSYISIIFFIQDSDYGKKKSSIFDKASIVASIPARWVLNPSYMHTFGITENFFIIVEQPLAICVFTLAVCQIKQEPISTCLKWHENENVSVRNSIHITYH